MPNDNSACLDVHDLSVSYDKKTALWGVDFQLPKGVLTGIIGPNGAGKSTLIKAIMGLIPLRSGEVKIFNEPIKNIRHRVSYVPQRESVDWDFPTTVEDVVLMGRYAKLGVFEKIKLADREAANDALQKTGLIDLKNRQISELSGGQQQRVFLARALAQDADIYFMDEPFAGVDMATEKSIIEILKSMKAKGKTVLVVHHDLASVSDYFDWLILINMRLLACGPTNEVFTKEKLDEMYGGRLNILSKAGEILAKTNLPLGEKQKSI